MKRKIAIVVQRYGEEVNGGAEYYCKKLAEHLLPYYEVEVLTSTAKDYDTWACYYAAGECKLEGVKVIRFPVEKSRSIMKFRFLKSLMLVLPSTLKMKIERLWLREQGPYCPLLVNYINMHKDDYYRFIFVTYLYYPTVMGMTRVYDKALLIPTAHDEYCIRFDIYKDVFCNPKGIMYLTEEEKVFVENLFGNFYIPHVVAGAGIDASQYKNKVNVENDSGSYLIYVGRVDRGKNCHTMFRYFKRFKKSHPSDLKLIVVGKMMMKSPHEKDIVCMGFVSEEKKYALMYGARALILPSHYESLSLAVLEAFSIGVPVLVDGKCEVLKNHCKRSAAGYVYKNYAEFENCILNLFNLEEDYRRMKECGKKYVEENYTWDCTIKKCVKLIEG